MTFPSQSSESKVEIHRFMFMCEALFISCCRFTFEASPGAYERKKEAKGRILVHFPWNLLALKLTVDLEILCSALSRHYLCFCVFKSKAKRSATSTLLRRRRGREESAGASCRLASIVLSKRNAQKDDERSSSAVRASKALFYGAVERRWPRGFVLARSQQIVS